MRSIATILLLIACGSVHGQTMTAAETVKNYSIAQKRLLVISTFQFANIITQNNLDQDSVMSMACRITGMPFLLPYTEALEDTPSPGKDLINAGRIDDAVALANQLENEKKIQLLIELGIWYLHQQGTHKADLDNANIYIASVLQLCIRRKSLAREKECRFLTAELSYQSRNILDAKNILNQILMSGQKEGTNDVTARAYNQFAVLFSAGDSMKIIYYQKSLELYNQLRLNEKAVTNAIKYAFPQNKRGIIEISMHKVADKMTLLISDNGIGIDESLLNAATASLGLKLIKGLGADINATISFKNAKGTKISIVFNVDPLSGNDNLLLGINEKELYA